MHAKHLLLPIAALASIPDTADACGGFFCSQAPVLQTAERIVFEVDVEQVTAYVQLQYVGDDFNFAWIVPVPSTPQIEVGVGQAMFDALDRQTRPQFVAQAAVFASDEEAAGCGGGGFDASPWLTSRYVPAPEVNVYAQERVGPYDAVVLDAEDARDLNDWLGINGYTLVQGSDSIVQEYLDDGMKLLALKLAPGEGVEAIEPVKLTYENRDGCAQIPVKLTAIAATPALQITTWVFGPGRAAPMNFEEAELDLSRAFDDASYRTALAAGVNAAPNGHGVVTEYARPSAYLDAAGDPELEALLARNAYVTRISTELDPAEMTVDPEFTIDASLPDVSNEIQGGRRLALTTNMTFGFLALYLLARRRWSR